MPQIQVRCLACQSLSSTNALLWVWKIIGRIK